MKIASVTDETTASGLRLAGVRETRVAESREETIEALEGLLEEGDWGVIVLTEELAAEVEEWLSEFREERSGVAPIVIEIPGRKGPVPERRESIDKLVKRAVGINIGD